MTRTLLPLIALLGLVVACDSKKDEKKADDKKVDAKKADAKKADAKGSDAKGSDAKAADPKADAKAPDAPPPEDKPAAAADKELDLAAWGPAFAGYVAMAPEGTKVELDDPSRQMILSDVDFLSMGEAPGYADAVKGLAGDKDNSNIQIVSDTEARWERNPPLGKQWNFDIKVDIGGKPWSCNGGTFTDAAMADKLVAICKSIKKK
jgi:hypothetical protein